MKISGFSLIRNGIRFEYPFLESIQSALPLVDEFVVNVGYGDDQTIHVLKEFAAKEGNGKLRIIESDWELDNPEKKRAGLILSEQSNIALNQCAHDWCLYLQADEVLHEKDLSNLRLAAEANLHNEIEGLLFDYLHFYGSYNVVQKGRSAYRREVRMIKKSSGAQSIGDAQSFRKRDGTKLRVLRSGARIFHYGWVRPPEAMKDKTFFMDQLYHGDPSEKAKAAGLPHTGENYRYKKFWGLREYNGEHPGIMSDRIRNKGWHWDLNSAPWIWNWSDLKKVLLDSFESFSGVRLFEYRSYKLVKAPPTKTGMGT